MSSETFPNPTLLAALIASLTALILFILAQTLVPRIERKRLLLRNWADLISEVEQNRRHQEASSFISLEHDAFKRFRQAGFLSDLKDDLREELARLYSDIHEKNELIEYYRAGLAGTGQIPVVVDASRGNPVPVTDVISRIRVSVENRINALLPQLREKYLRLRDQ